ncbi:protein EFFECTOR OF TRANSCRIPTION 2-like [Gossypium hirsutum]|uniref:Protein EFFECTOR OF TRANSCRIPTION 2-like n=1 Tax=Gossypium hirsutum TaxID=3635 RepID=A0A1U8M0X6_GOSHI|nr:protein EFFECTOR OF TRANSCRIPTION 2-like [Gossypium hirsutum]
MPFQSGAIRDICIMVLIVEEDKIPMQLLAVHVDRSKREYHKKTDHDSHFSEWKLLVGPHDWKNGKDGAVTRYRFENLPEYPGPGIYELAVCKLPSRDRHGKLEPDLVVYLGKSGNIRARLQQHGRNGTHLCGKNGFGENGCPLFDIFARGWSITYRWASMENKADARRTEDQLLRTYDYAWNKGSNGVRRYDDILEKLDKRASNLIKVANFSKKHLPFLQKQVGIKIKASKLVSVDNEFGKYKNEENLNFWPEVLNFSRSRPRLVLNHGGFDENETFSCGVVLDAGSICKRPPVEGRKRCSEHKGKKTTGSSTSSSMKSQPYKEDYPEIEHCSPICGVAMDDGSLCRRRPVSGRKRCDLHKGRRIYSSNSEITRYQTTPYAVFNSYSDEASDFYENRTGMAISIYNRNNCSTPICGVPTCNGIPCKRTGNVNGRCWQHLKYSGSRSSSNDFTPRNSNNGEASDFYENRTGMAISICNRNNCSTPICGVPTCNGTPCKRTGNVNGRCWQHLNYSGSRSSSNDFTPRYSNNDSTGTSICGAPTRNGSSCRRPVKGNGRCWQHL